MNKLIVLPGNSQRNKEWGEGVLAHFGGYFDESVMQSYDHWSNEEETINFEVELKKLQAVVELSAGKDTFFIFAKSAGTLLALLAVQRGIISPKQCIFFGMPLEWADRDVWQGDWSPLSVFQVPTLAFHNNNDPTANFAFTKKVLQEHAAKIITLVTTVGDDHSYTNFNEYTSAITNFLSR